MRLFLRLKIVLTVVLPCIVTILFACPLPVCASFYAPLKADFFTPAEQEFLAGHPVVRVAMDPDWAPIEYVDRNGVFHGISMEYLKVIEQFVGIRFDIAKNLTWQEMLVKVKAGELDMFSAITKTPERSSYLVFTKPFFSSPVVLFTRRDINYLGSLKDLDGMRIGVVEGFASQEWLVRDHPEIKLFPVQSPKDGLDLLRKGSIDVFAGNLVSGSYQVSISGDSGIKVSGETGYVNSLAFGIRKDWEIFAGIMQKALDAMPEEARRGIYRDWISIKYEHGEDYKVIFAVVFVSTLIISVFFYYNRRLSLAFREKKRLSREREKIILDLEEALGKVKTLSGLLPICASCKKIRDDSGYWNRIEQYLEMHTGAEFSHGMCPECMESYYGNQDWFRKLKVKKDDDIQEP